MQIEDEAALGLVVTKSDGVLTLTLDKPRRKNVISRAMVTETIAAIEGTIEDDAIRVIVIRAEGADFCAGFDLAESNGPTFTGGSRPKTGHLQRGMPRWEHGMIRALDIVQVPVVAVVRGWAAGIGCMLALTADVVLADPTAKFWIPMVKRGFTPDSGSTWLLPRLVGVARAKHMLLRGAPVDGETAAQWGLISTCVAADELDAAAAAVVEEFRCAATVAVGLGKTLIHRNLEVDFASGLQNEGIYEELAIRSEDFKEGIRAFGEKRQPGYTGR